MSTIVNAHLYLIPGGEARHAASAVISYLLCRVAMYGRLHIPLPWVSLLQGLSLAGALCVQDRL